MKQEYADWSKNHSDLVAFLDESKEIIYLHENFQINCNYYESDICYLENSENKNEYISLIYNEQSKNFVLAHIKDEKIKLDVYNEDRLLFLFKLLKIFQAKDINIVTI